MKEEITLSKDVRPSARQEVLVRFGPKDATEPIVRAFLLERTDVLRLTAEHVDDSTRRALTHLRQRPLRKEMSHQRYPQIPQCPADPVTHYYFRLSSALRRELEEATILWRPESDLSALVDPTFLVSPPNGWPVLLGHVISHEGMVFLNVTEDEAIALSNCGVELLRL